LKTTGWRQQVGDNRLNTTGWRQQVKTTC